MKNVIIYSDKSDSKVKSLLENMDDLDVRIKNISEAKDAIKYNPSLMVIDAQERAVKDFAMVTKLAAPTLIVADKFYDDVICRGNSFDYIITPINPKEFELRVKNLLRIAKKNNRSLQKHDFDFLLPFMDVKEKIEYDGYFNLFSKQS